MKDPNGSKDILIEFVLRGGIYVIIYMIGNMILSALIYGMMHVYDHRNERLMEKTLGEFKETLFRLLGE